MKTRRKLGANSMQPREPTPCFLFGRVTYLPDYVKKDVWHGPGGRVYKKEDLLDYFPMFRSLLLWERPYTVDVRP